MNDNTEVIPLDADTLEVRHYDDGRPGKYRCWQIPLHEARDIARWWAETGSRAAADRPPRDAQRIGSIRVSFLSANQVYALGCDERGWSKITGYQLPRDAVVFLQEMLLTKTSERQGRVIDQDEGGAGMEEKKKRGYF